VKLLIILLPTVDSFVPGISMFDSLELQQIMKLLATVDQDEYKTAMPKFDCSDPKSYWVFKNEDFLPWDSAASSRLLWLLGPPECGLSRIASTVVDREINATDKSGRACVQHLVLHFCCVESNVSPKLIARSLLYQIFCSLPPLELRAALTVFLRPLLEEIQRKAIKHRCTKKTDRDSTETGACKWPFQEADPPCETLKTVFDWSSSRGYWQALKAVFDSGCRQISIILDMVNRIKFLENDPLPNNAPEVPEPISSVEAFLGCLQMETCKVKVLLTSDLNVGPSLEGVRQAQGVTFIEYDAERKGF